MEGSVVYVTGPWNCSVQAHDGHDDDVIDIEDDLDDVIEEVEDLKPGQMPAVHHRQIGFDMIFESVCFASEMIKR